MPRNEYVSFKNDKVTKFAAQLMLQQISRAKYNHIFDNLSLYKKAVSDRVGLYSKDPESWHYKKVDELYIELESLSRTLFQSGINRDPIQVRQGLIDITRSIKKIQEIQNELSENKIHIFHMNDRVNGPWGNPDYIDAYVLNMHLCQEGEEYLKEAVFDENDPEVVHDYDEFSKLEHFSYYGYKQQKKNDRTYMMEADAFEEYKDNRPQFKASANHINNINPLNIINLDGNIQAKNGADPAYTVDVRVIENQQEFAKTNIVNSLLNSFSHDNNQGDAFARDINAFIQDLKQLHFDMKSKPDQLDDKMRHLDSLLSLRQIKKDNNGKLTVSMNLDEPEEPKLLDKLISFVYNIESYNSSKKTDEDMAKRQFNSIFSGSEDSFKEILMDLKDMQNDPMVPESFKAKCKPILNKFESVVKKAVDELQVAPFEKYVIMNTGKLNFGRGEAAVDGVAKVTAAYEWKKNNVRIKDPAKKETFSAEKMDKLAEDMKNNPIFKTYYKPHVNDKKWSKTFLESEARNSKEWRVNNIIDNPFASARLQDKKTALNKLKELGEVLPAPGSASDEYCHFNATLKSLSQKNINGLTDGELNHMLKTIFEENENYMKGRKSERYFDVSKEHFEETLDVLKIFSEVNDYGAAMAKKLVDRTNYVRKNRWHGMWSQDPVTLEGRDIEATKARIQVLVYGKKPAENKINNSGMKL